MTQVSAVCIPDTPLRGLLVTGADIASAETTKNEIVEIEAKINKLNDQLREERQKLNTKKRRLEEQGGAIELRSKILSLYGATILN